MRYLLLTCVAALAAICLFPLAGCEEGGGVNTTEAIVFMSNGPNLTQSRSGAPWVWLMPVDGSDRIPVTANTPNGNRMGALSPDGTNIVFAIEEGSGIYRFDLATGESTELYDAGDHPIAPTYSPDGGTILFAAEGPNLDSLSMDTMSPDGSNATVLLEAPADEHYANPSYNREGSKIVFQTGTNDNIAIMDANGSNVLPLTTGSGNIHPSFLPDGRILYTHHVGTGNFDLYIMDADGNNKRALTNTPSVMETYPTSNADGTLIAYANGDKYSGALGDILVAPFDGTDLGTPVNITTNYTDPCWRPKFGRVRTDLYDLLFNPPVM